jgi:hypothetical protein
MSEFIYDIFYGVREKNINVTSLLINESIKNIIYIPFGDHNRCFLFKHDPVSGVQKKIFILNKLKNEVIEYDISKQIYIDISSNIIYVDDSPEYINKILTDYYNSLSIICSVNKSYLLHPITFSIPEEKIVNNVPEKTKVVSVIIPSGGGASYSFNNETEYYNEYKSSMFGVTFKKGGWDCLRHYEILANGCIPYFMNIEKCPENTLFNYPKHLTMEGNKLFLKLQHKKINEILSEELQEYKTLLNKFLDYTRENLTTVKIAKYILEKTNNINISKVLYLSGDPTPDYLRCLTLHGFKSIFGQACHDYPKISHLYKNENINYNKLYGRGMTYTNLIDISYRNNELDDSIKEDIINHEYDIIIYGNYHRGIPYFELVKEHYSVDKIILLCGEDCHACDYFKYISDKYNVFVRELTNDAGFGVW